MALLDPSQRDLYVACTGDSRAVAGNLGRERGWYGYVARGSSHRGSDRAAAKAKPNGAQFLLGSVPATQSIHRFSSTSIHFTHSAYNPNTLQEEVILRGRISRRPGAVSGLWRCSLQMASRSATNVGLLHVSFASHGAQLVTPSSAVVQRIHCKYR